MPRGPETIYANLSFNGRDARVQEAARQAASSQMTLGTYLKKLVLAVLAQGPLLLLQFRASSRVLAHLQQEAEQVEMSLDAYVLALLADRDRSLYATDARPTSLWFPRGRTLRGDATLENGETEQEKESVNIDEAMHNVEEFLAGMADMAGF